MIETITANVVTHSKHRHPRKFGVKMKDVTELHASCDLANIENIKGLVSITVSKLIECSFLDDDDRIDHHPDYSKWEQRETVVGKNSVSLVFVHEEDDSEMFAVFHCGTQAKTRLRGMLENGEEVEFFADHGNLSDALNSFIDDFGSGDGCGVAWAQLSDSVVYMPGLNSLFYLQSFNGRNDVLSLYVHQESALREAISLLQDGQLEDEWVDVCNPEPAYCIYYLNAALGSSVTHSELLGRML